MALGDSLTTLEDSRMALDGRWTAWHLPCRIEGNPDSVARHPTK